jgi:hypothetical protein
MATAIRTGDDAHAFLRALGAPARLIAHARLVGEAAAALVAKLDALGVACDSDLVSCGAALHDVGKILVPGELSGPGSEHEAAGERLLLAQGLPAELAKICRSHAQWRQGGCSFEELLIALADQLWKGSRCADLELAVIDAAAARLGKQRWDLFIELDGAFEDIAARGVERLAESRA